MMTFIYMVKNSFVLKQSTADKPKERITALRAIGDIDGVDAFKKHTEVVHKSMSMDDKNPVYIPQNDQPSFKPWTCRKSSLIFIS